MVTIILTFILVLVLDGLVSATEAAFFATPINRARFLADKDKLFAKTLLHLKKHSSKPIATLLALSNIITLVGAVVVGAQTAAVFGSGAVGVTSAIFTFLVMVFAEIVPKRLGERWAERYMLPAAPLLKTTSIVFTPLIWFIELMVRPFSAPIPHTVSEEELIFLARMGSKEGAIEEDESALIAQVFRLNDITAFDVMTPRPQVFFLDGNRMLDDAKEEIMLARHTRIPVFDGTRDNIIGVVHQRELLGALARQNYNTLIREYTHPALFVPENRVADGLLRDFQEKKMHLAIVVDDNGGVAGVVGLEDILEELVGETIDEAEVRPDLIKRMAKDEIMVHGQTRIEAVDHFFNTTIKSRKTVNGFLLSKFGRIPNAGEKLKLNGLEFTIEDVGPQAISRVRIKKEIPNQ